MQYPAVELQGLISVKSDSLEGLSGTARSSSYRYPPYSLSCLQRDRRDLHNFGEHLKITRTYRYEVKPIRKKDRHDAEDRLFVL